MFVASARYTNRGAKQFVQDNGIDLSRKPSMPRLKVIDAAPRLEKMAREAEKLRTLQKDAADLLEQAKQAAANYRAKHFGAGNSIRSYSTVERRICKALKVTKDQIHSVSRKRNVTLARQAVMYWAYRSSGLSLEEIGRRINRDHTSVLYGKQVYPEKRKAMGRRLRSV